MKLRFAKLNLLKYNKQQRGKTFNYKKCMMLYKK